MYWQHILDNKTRQYANQLSLQSPCKPECNRPNTARPFIQREVSEKIRAAIEENDFHFANFGQRAKEHAPISLSRLQHDELVKLAVDQRDAHWEWMMDSERGKHAKQIEQLQEQIEVLQDENLRQGKTHMAKSKLENAAKDASHGRQLSAKDALMIGVGQI